MVGTLKRSTTFDSNKHSKSAVVFFVFFSPPVHGMQIQLTLKLEVAIEKSYYEAIQVSSTVLLCLILNLCFPLHLPITQKYPV